MVAKKVFRKKKHLVSIKKAKQLLQLKLKLRKVNSIDKSMKEKEREREINHQLLVFKGSMYVNLG